MAIIQEQYDQILAILQGGRNDPLSNSAGITFSTSLGDAWIIDIGATNHMCSSPQLLQSLSLNTFLLNVQIVYGSTAQITKIGATFINSSLHLNNIFLIPS